MVIVLRRALEVIGESGRARWALLVLLALFSSVVEAAGSVLVYSLITMATAKGGALTVPLLGDLSKQFPGADRSTIVTVMAVALGLFFVFRGALLCWQVFAQNRLAQRTGVSISRELVRGYLRMPYGWHLERNSSELMRTTYDSVDRVAAYILLPAVTMLSEGLVVLALLVVLVVTAPAATGLALLVLGPVLVLLAKVVRPRLGVLGHDTQRLVKETLEGLTQTFEGVREITLLGKRDHFEERLAHVRTGLATATYRRAGLVEVPRYSIETASMIFILLFLSVGIAQSSSQGKPFAVLGLFAYAVLRLMPSMNRTLAYSNLLKFGTAALEQVRDDLLMVRALPTALEATVQPRPLTSAIELRGVSFRYPTGDRDVLSEVDLTIPVGQSVGIVGPTGGGKSTLVDLVLGLLTPTAGSVLVDGRDLQEDLPGWQLTLGAVPQHIFLLDDTLRANIAFGVDPEDVDQEALVEAVRLAQLADVVERQPQGLDTVVGERGIRLSGGQRQRVAIARALYRNASVLAFDEGTSALDNLTEAELVADLDRLRGTRTILTVAHRLTTVRGCDRILVVVDGRIAASGTYDELREGSDVFRQLAV